MVTHLRSTSSVSLWCILVPNLLLFLGFSQSVSTLPSSLSSPLLFTLSQTLTHPSSRRILTHTSWSLLPLLHPFTSPRGPLRHTRGPYLEDLKVALYRGSGLIMVTFSKVLLRTNFSGLFTYFPFKTKDKILHMSWTGSDIKGHKGKSDLNNTSTPSSVCMKNTSLQTGSVRTTRPW